MDLDNLVIIDSMLPYVNWKFHLFDDNTVNVPCSAMLNQNNSLSSDSVTDNWSELNHNIVDMLKSRF